MYYPPFDINSASYRLDLINMVLSKHRVTFSKAVAAKLVGGEYRLEKLVREGKIRAEKPTAKQNGKWFCNGADVLKYVTM